VDRRCIFYEARKGFLHIIQTNFELHGINTGSEYTESIYTVIRDTERHIGAPGQANILAPLHTNMLQNFWSTTRLANLFWGNVPKLRIIFKEILSRVELLASYFQLFQWYLRTAYRSVAWAATQLACHTVWALLAVLKALVAKKNLLLLSFTGA
jgi:hypothetical protein